MVDEIKLFVGNVGMPIVSLLFLCCFLTLSGYLFLLWCAKRPVALQKLFFFTGLFFAGLITLVLVYQLLPKQFAGTLSALIPYLFAAVSLHVLVSAVQRALYKRYNEAIVHERSVVFIIFMYLLFGACAWVAMYTSSPLLISFGKTVTAYLMRIVLVAVVLLELFVKKKPIVPSTREDAFDDDSYYTGRWDQDI